MDAASDSVIEEYTYESDNSHLTGSKALDKYRRAMGTKAADTLVILDSHDCGHWTVTELKTPEERLGHFQRLYQKFVAQILDTVRAR